MHDCSHATAGCRSAEMFENKEHERAGIAVNSLPFQRTGGERKLFSSESFLFPFAVLQDLYNVVLRFREGPLYVGTSGPNFSPGQNAFAESSPASRFRRCGGSGGSVEREAERKRMEIERE